MSRSFLKVLSVSFSLASLCLPASSSSAQTLFSETFNTDTATTSQTLTTYPAFMFTGDSACTVQVVGGVLEMALQGPPSVNGAIQQVSINGFTGDLKINVDIGKTPGDGNFYTGLVVGGNRLLFHPGYPTGAFRVEGIGGFGNQDMGFTPVGASLHHMQVAITAATGAFAIQITDANNPLNVYTTSFTNPNYMPGDRIGFVTAGGADNQQRIVAFDNLRVSVLASAVPEPGTYALLGGLGLTGDAFLRRRKVHKAA